MALKKDGTPDVIDPTIDASKAETVEGKEGTVNTIHTDPATTVSTTQPKIAAEKAQKLYAVRVVETHNCMIGGHKYRLLKGEEVSLPEDACAILQNSGIVIKK